MMKSSIKRVANRYLKVAEYSAERGYTTVTHRITWRPSESGSDVPVKYKKIWESIKGFGEAIQKSNPRRSKRGAVIQFSGSNPNVKSWWWEDENEDKANVIHIELPLFSKVFIAGEEIRTWDPTNNEKQAVLKYVKTKLKGARIKRFQIYHNKISIQASFGAWAKPKQNRTEVFVPSGSGNDLEEQVVYALEEQLGFYPQGFTIHRVDDFEDDEDIVSVSWW